MQAIRAGGQRLDAEERMGALSHLIDDLAIDIGCPRCHFASTVTLKSIRLGGVIICRGCKANIVLCDHLDSVKRAVRGFSQAISKLERQLRL